MKASLNYQIQRAEAERLIAEMERDIAQTEKILAAWQAAEERGDKVQIAFSIQRKSKD